MLRIRVKLVVLLLTGIIIIFVLPAADLPPTALRSLKMANALMAGFALAGLYLSSLFRSVNHLPTAPVAAHRNGPPRPPDLLNLNCARLC